MRSSDTSKCWRNMHTHAELCSSTDALNIRTRIKKVYQNTEILVLHVRDLCFSLHKCSIISPSIRHLVLCIQKPIFISRTMISRSMRSLYSRYASALMTLMATRVCSKIGRGQVQSNEPNCEEQKRKSTSALMTLTATRVCSKTGRGQIESSEEKGREEKAERRFCVKADTFKMACSHEPGQRKPKPKPIVGATQASPSMLS